MSGHGIAILNDFLSLSPSHYLDCNSRDLHVSLRQNTSDKC